MCVYDLPGVKYETYNTISLFKKTHINRNRQCTLNYITSKYYFQGPSTIGTRSKITFIMAEYKAYHSHDVE